MHREKLRSRNQTLLNQTTSPAYEALPLRDSQVWLTAILALAALLLALGNTVFVIRLPSTWHLFNSRLTNRANAVSHFVALTLYLMFEIAKRVRTGRPYLAWAWLAGLVNGLGFHTYTSFRVTPLLILSVSIYSLVLAWREGLWTKFCLAAAGFAGAANIWEVSQMFFWRGDTD